MGRTRRCASSSSTPPRPTTPTPPPECYGQEASAYPSWLLSLGGTLYLESDISDRDRFDRLLRYAWLDFGDGEVYVVNEVMARSVLPARINGAFLTA